MTPTPIEELREFTIAEGWALEEIWEHYDTLTAENERLKGQNNLLSTAITEKVDSTTLKQALLEALQSDVTKALNANITALKGEVERLSEELRLANCEITDLKVDVDVTIRENATLRSKLDALVTAGEKVVYQYQYVLVGYIDTGDLAEACRMDGDIDVLSAAVREAKGEK